MAKDTNNLCALGGDMLAYLYNEMAEADRDRFDLHLIECDSCTDEFAEISQARYPVYEWKKLEFEPMLTPVIVLPAAAISWFDKAKATFSFTPRFSVAMAGFAVILLLAVAGLSWLGFRSDKDELAQSKIVDPSRSPIPSVEPPPVPKAANRDDSRTVTTKSTPSKKDGNASVSDVQAVKISVPKPKNTVNKDAKTRTPAKRDVTAPGLTQFADDEDDSLRLAELFNDIDTDRSKL
jgi:hypothetical protein